MIIAICHINDRQHCAGVWSNMDDAKNDLAQGYTITDYSKDIPFADKAGDPFAASAHAMYVAEIRDDAPDSFDMIRADVENFTLYEYTDTFPRYCPFDQD